MLLDLVNRISSERKVKKKFRHASLRTLNVLLGTSRINLPGTSIERQIKTSPGRHFRTSRGRQIGTSLGRQIGSLGDVLGTLEGDVLGTSWGPIFTGWVVCLKNSYSFFYNGSNYDYHFILKEFVKEFKKTIYFFRRKY